MLDIKRIRENFEEVRKAVESRQQGDFGLAHVLETDEKRRRALEAIRIAEEFIEHSNEVAIEAERIIEGGAR